MDTAKRLRHIAKGWTPQAAYPGTLRRSTKLEIPKLEGMTKHESRSDRRSRTVTAKRLRHIAKGWTPQAAYPGGKARSSKYPSTKE